MADNDVFDQILDPRGGCNLTTKHHSICMLPNAQQAINKSKEAEQVLELLVISILLTLIVILIIQAYLKAHILQPVLDFHLQMKVVKSHTIHTFIKFIL